MTIPAGNPAIPAATILLLRDKPALEVLMIERHAKIQFAGGALVFPGGRIDPGDAPDRWRDRAIGLDGLEPELASARIAAIREAFEETGILFADDKQGKMISGARAGSLARSRARIEKDNAKFLELIETENLRLACNRLTPFAHWVPPDGFHNKRFDTWFFACVAPRDQAISADGGEATEAMWIEPKEALAAREREERAIIFPTARNLELLAVSSTASQVLADAANRTIRQVQPALIERDGAQILTIPDDLGYPVTEEPLSKGFRG